MRSPLRPARAAASGVAALLAVAGGCLPDSPYVVATSDSGACDVIVNEGNAAATLAQLNDAGKRVFCVEAGDYRSAGQVRLLASGSEASPRFLRFHPADGIRNAVQRSERALFHSLRIRGSWWVIQGLTIQPATEPAPWYVGIEGGDHNVIEGNLVDGSEHVNTVGAVGIIVTAFGADPATHNVIQANVVRSGNRSRLPEDYIGIAVADGTQPGADNDFTRILDNEIYDWGDGVSVAGTVPDCTFPGRPHGTVIDGNDIYLTGDKRIDCATGAPDPDGDCACAENGIDVKPDPGPDLAAWTRITNNRLWGFRPTPDPSTCGGSGSHGQAITAGNQCPGHVLVAGNVVTDSTAGIKPSGPSWILAGNLLHDLQGGILTQSNASGLEIQFNTIVRAESAYDDMSADTVTRCNAVIDNLGTGGNGGPRGAGHQTEYNFLYDSPTENFGAGTNQVFETAAESQNENLCYLRRRWTAPELVCVPFARTTSASPHLAAIPSCEPELALSFGLRPFGYASIQTVPEPRSTQIAAAALLALVAVARGLDRAAARRRRVGRGIRARSAGGVALP